MYISVVFLCLVLSVYLQNLRIKRKKHILESKNTSDSIPLHLHLGPVKHCLQAYFLADLRRNSRILKHATNIPSFVPCIIQLRRLVGLKTIHLNLI